MNKMFLATALIATALFSNVFAAAEGDSVSRQVEGVQDHTSQLQDHTSQLENHASQLEVMHGALRSHADLLEKMQGQIHLPQTNALRVLFFVGVCSACIGSGVTYLYCRTPEKR